MPRGSFNNTSGVVTGASDFVPSEEQAAIMRAFAHTDKHLIVEAVAGSGKTKTIVECAKLDKQSKIGLTAFNKHIATELTQRMGGQTNVECMTYHSLGFRCVRDNVRHRVNVDQYKVLGYLDTLSLPVKGVQEKVCKYKIASMVGYAKTYGHDGDVDEEELHKIADRHDLDLNGLSDVVVDYAPKVLRWCASNTHVIDFDDMVWLPYVLKLNVPRFDVLCVDEYQDTSMCQQWIAVRGGVRVVAVGDPHQCHPAGTQITLANNKQVPIEAVKVGDRVINYVAKESRFYGTNDMWLKPKLRTDIGRRVEAVSTQDFKGKLVVLRAGNQTVRVTPNHRVLVRIPENKSWYAVYMMVRGRHARIGMCQMSYAIGCGPSMRARQEKADKTYVLDTFPSESQARIAELAIAARFGLPDMIFNNTGQTSPSQDFIDAVYLQIPTNLDRAQACLKHFGREWDYPFWSAETNHARHIGRYSFVMEACNVLDGIMQMRTFGGLAVSGEWSDVVITHERFNGKVYGIQVEEWKEDGRRLYVANNLVVHNSIYSFRGCDGLGFEKLRRDLAPNIITLPLSLTRRCPKSHVRLAQMLVPQIHAMPDAPEGVVRETASLDAAVSEMRPGDLVVCRVNAELVGVAYKLLKRGVKAVVRGRDIGSGMTKLIDAAVKRCGGFDVTLQDAIEHAGAITNEQVGKFLSMPNGRGEMRASNAQDKYACLCELAEGCQTVSELRATIEKLFAEFEEDGQPKNAVVLGTVHRTKGLEGNRVFVLRPDLIPHPMAKKPADVQAEMNLAYVAVTRARYEAGKVAELIFVGGPCMLFSEGQGVQEAVDAGKVADKRLKSRGGGKGEGKKGMWVEAEVVDAMPEHRKWQGR